MNGLHLKTCHLPVPFDSDAEESGSSSYYTVGSLVWKNFLQKKQSGGKLDHPWMGPFLIVESLGKGLFDLQKVNGKKTSLDNFFYLCLPTALYTTNINPSS